MRTRIHQALVTGLAALLIASVAAPGLTMHNCRQFGTRSTKLCACCEAELESSRSCCSQKPSAAQQAVHAETVLESSCCFTSHEEPFSFDGQNVAKISDSAPTQHDLAIAYPSVDGEDVAQNLEAIPHSTFHIRHSSDPPSYILTHSFRC